MSILSIARLFFLFAFVILECISLEPNVDIKIATIPILMNISTLAIILPSVVTGVRLFGAIVDTIPTDYQNASPRFCMFELGAEDSTI